MESLISKDFNREQLMQLLIAEVGCYSEDFLNHLRPFIMHNHFDIVKTAKYHRCFICHHSIAAGTYVYSRTLIIGDKYTGFKLCSLHCLKMFARQLIDKRFPEVFEELRQPVQPYQRSEDQPKDKTLDSYW